MSIRLFADDEMPNVLDIDMSTGRLNRAIHRCHQGFELIHWQHAVIRLGRQQLDVGIRGVPSRPRIVSLLDVPKVRRLRKELI